MLRYMRLRAVPALLFLAAAIPCCNSFLLFSPARSSTAFSRGLVETSPPHPSVSSRVGAAARCGGGVVGLGMKRKNGASGQQQGVPSGGRNGGRGGNDVLGGRADQKYAYVQGGFAERQAPTQGNNTSMCVPLLHRAPVVPCLRKPLRVAPSATPSSPGML
jgi:hypothetical protein